MARLMKLIFSPIIVARSLVAFPFRLISLSARSKSGKRRRARSANQPVRRKKAARAANQIRAKAVGVAFANADGTLRQEILGRCRVGEPLSLMHRPSRHDRNAIEVRRRSTGEMIGYLSRELSADLAPQMKTGSRFRAEITALTGGDGRHRGCNIVIIQVR